MVNRFCPFSTIFLISSPSPVPCIMDKTLTSRLFAEGPWKYVVHILFVSDTWHDNHYHSLFFQLGGTGYWEGTILRPVVCKFGNTLSMNSITNPISFKIDINMSLGVSCQSTPAWRTIRLQHGAHQRSQHNTHEQTIVDLVGHLNGVTCTTSGLCCFAVLLDR